MVKTEFHHRLIISSIQIDLSKIHVLSDHGALEASLGEIRKLSTDLTMFSNIDNEGLFFDYILSKSENSSFSQGQFSYINNQITTHLDQEVIKSYISNKDGNIYNVEIVYSTVSLPSKTTLLVNQSFTKITEINNISEVLLTIYYPDLEVYKADNNSVLLLQNNTYKIVLVMFDVTHLYNYIRSIKAYDGNTIEGFNSTDSESILPVPTPDEIEGNNNKNILLNEHSDEQFRSMLFEVNNKIPVYYIIL